MRLASFIPQIRRTPYRGIDARISSGSNGRPVKQAQIRRLAKTYLLPKLEDFVVLRRMLIQKPVDVQLNGWRDYTAKNLRVDQLLQ